MNFSKRAFISVRRRKANSLILLLIVFILANVLLTTLSVTTALKNTRQSVLSQLNPVVSMEPDFQKLMGDSEMKVPNITNEKANSVYEKTKDLVKSYDYSMTIYGEGAPGFKGSDLPSNDSFSFGGSENTMLNMSGTQLPKTSGVDSDAAQLIKGTGFTEDDIKNGAKKGLISKELAEANNLDIGSLFKVAIPVYDQSEMATNGMPKVLGKVEEEIEVAGILDYKAVNEFISDNKDKKNANPSDYFAAQQKADGIILPNTTIKNLLDQETAEAEKLGLSFDEDLMASRYSVIPTYVLNDYQDIQSFTEIARTVIPEDTITIKSATDSYAQVAKPLESMESLLDMVFVITVVASLIILSLVLCIFMYLRQKEMGIFLALGEKKNKIVGQLILESLFVCLIGASLAILTSMIFSSMLADSALQAMLTPVDGMDMGSNIIIGGNSALPSIDADLISQQYQGGFTPLTIVTFYLIMIATIFLAQLATVLYLLRMNPKKILM